MCRSRTTFHFVPYGKQRISDGSLNLRFDYLPANLGETTIQVRSIEKADAEPVEGELIEGPAA